MPEVSVIIPVFKAEAYIARCARSLFESTLRDMEFIFVDDCTPDNSIAVLRTIVDEYPDRSGSVKILRHETNRGQMAARHTGFKESKGKFVAFCDADDWVAPTMYQQMYEKAMGCAADLVYCNYFEIRKSGVVRGQNLEYKDDKKTLFHEFLRYPYKVVWNLLIDRRLLGLYDWGELYGRTYCEDSHQSIFLFQKSKRVAKVDAHLYYYDRTNEHSVTKHLNDRTMWDEIFCYLATIRFFESEGVLPCYEREMSWHILKSKQDLLLSPDTHEKYLDIYPVSSKYIFSCPYLGKKMKLMAWLLTHHLRPCLLAIIALRRALGR